MNSHDHHRPFGKTGLNLPRIAFRADFLDSSNHQFTDPTKRVICAEWFQRVVPPVLINVPSGTHRGSSLMFLTRTLDRYEIQPEHVAINLELSAADYPNGTLDAREIIAEVKKVAEVSAGRYPPKLLTIAIPEAPPGEAPSRRAADDRLPALANVLPQLRTESALRHLPALGIQACDWRLLQHVIDNVEPDFVAIAKGPTVVQHPPELLNFLSELERRKTPVITGGVFHGGFLAGEPCIDRRPINEHDARDHSLLTWRKAFTSLCHGHGVRPAHACIQYALSAPGVAAVSLRTSNADRVTENVESVVTPVPNALWQSMKEEGLLGNGSRANQRRP